MAAPGRRRPVLAAGPRDHDRRATRHGHVRSADRGPRRLRPPLPHQRLRRLADHPDVGAATGTADLDRLADAADAATGLATTAGLGDSGTATTALDDLVDRIQRAALVGRSALVTPMLLVAVLGGYTLLLVAALLGEKRRAETALLRARGAARWQLAGLAGREAALVVAPAILLAPPLATELLRHAGRIPALAEASLRLQPRLDVLTWTAALLVAAGCALAMLGPNLRRGDSYVADLAARSRPGRRGAVQRAGADVVLVVVALLG
ncbi:ABC transporter permease [Micromonospora inyonensis]|uniref:FtsX-like permease family protein n=1 Tax=Micromonospora inyonensis TaxID=47866 RepID=A0A1C6SC15_9ACTN|nr:FtsX-like permease family protein [Micromonospora inyonensis]SCL27021.1 FtsX-like permease family protein [Micromonospora inyonensis]